MPPASGPSGEGASKRAGRGPLGARPARLRRVADLGGPGAAAPDRRGPFLPAPEHVSTRRPAESPPPVDARGWGLRAGPGACRDRGPAVSKRGCESCTGGWVLCSVWATPVHSHALPEGVELSPDLSTENPSKNDAWRASVSLLGVAAGGGARSGRRRAPQRGEPCGANGLRERRRLGVSAAWGVGRLGRGGAQRAGLRRACRANSATSLGSAPPNGGGLSVKRCSSSEAHQRSASASSLGPRASGSLAGAGRAK